MKIDISHLPLKRQRELETTVSILLEEFEQDIRFSTSDKKKSRIEKIILYGSYARDDWKEDYSSGFSSDYDILAVVSHAKMADFDARWITNANDRFMRYELMKMSDYRPQPTVSLIVHTIREINSNLRRGRYFFTDIVKEGIILYEPLKPRNLAKPGNLTPDVALEEAQMHYDEWYCSAIQFLKTHEYGKSFGGRLNISAFQLHQATEQLYHCILLVLTNYSPASHNIKFLRSQCEQRDTRLIDVWPRATKREESHFNKLKEAYVKARYSRHWKIAPERLDWLTDRVQQLTKVAKAICEERLTELEKQAKK